VPRDVGAPFGKEEVMTDGNMLITGLFTDYESAERGLTSLTSRGYTASDVRLQMMGDTRDQLLATAVQHDKDNALAALVTALVGERIPEERTALYEHGLCAGGIVMGVSPRSPQDAESLQREWVAAGAREIFNPLVRKNAA
jgi:hypothetical protein